jgi:hypothetical protein
VVQWPTEQASAEQLGGLRAAFFVAERLVDERAFLVDRRFFLLKTKQALGSVILHKKQLELAHVRLPGILR